MGAGAPNRTPMGGGQGPSNSMPQRGFMPQGPGGQGQMHGRPMGPMPQNQSFQDMISQMRPQRPMGQMRPPMQGMANSVAQQGRFGDSTLVHMNPQEVRGLAALHPQGRLPTNPQTGYPEAFDLFGALSGLVGGGLGFLVGGPLGAAVGSGLATTAYTGDIGKGLVSGLLGFGLGQAGSLLGGLGGEAASQAAQAAGTTAAETASPFVSNAVVPVTEQAVQQGVNAATQQGANAITQQALTSGAPTGGLNVQPSFFDKIGSNIGNNYDTLMRIPENVQNDPSLLSKTFLSNGLKTTVPIGMGLYGAATMPDQSAPMAPPAESSQSGSSPPQSNRPMRALTPPPAGYKPPLSGGPEWNWFSNNYQSGGKVESKDDRRTFQEEINRARRIPLWKAERELNDYQPLQKPTPSPFYRDNREYQFARGGYVPTPAISSMSGRRISGPGGGLDDAIPAVINGRELAHLSSGEHVIPASAVSALGNGSTEDGHRQIEQSIDRVMTKKFGTRNRNPRPIKAGSFLR